MSERKRLSTVRCHVPDLDRDGQVMLQSTISESHEFHRGLKEDFSFSDTDLVMIVNRGESAVTLNLLAFACAEGGLFIGSNRRAGTGLKEGETLRLKLRPRETLSVRSVRAREPLSAGGAELRPGQSVLI